jgi:Uma2 family endonuclease
MSVVLHQWTVDDYRRAIAAGALEQHAVELLLGQIIKMPPEGPSHAYADRTVADLLRSQLAEQAYISEAHPITLSDQSEPEPDIAVVRLPSSLYRERHPEPQDIFWVIEISGSSLEKDLTDKLMAYAQSGIGEYWIADLEHGKVVVLREPEGQQYLSRQELAEGTISPLSFPSIAVPISLLLGR